MLLDQYVTSQKSNVNESDKTSLRFLSNMADESEIQTVNSD